MKKLLSLTLLSFSLTLFQSCSPDDSDAAPEKVIATPTGINIESAAKAISENISLSGAKAFLLKPVDNDPNTNLTTLFYADEKGIIRPIVENFEVKQIEITNNGIYVLTNYSGIAFFVKYDLSWVEIKDVGDYAGVMEGNIVFTDGSVLNTVSLKVDKKAISLISISDGIMLVKSKDKYKVVNTSTGVGHEVNYNSDLVKKDLISINDNKNAFLITSEIGLLIDMKTGILTQLAYEDLYKPQAVVRNAAGNGIIAISSLYQSNPDKPQEDGLYLSYLTFDYNSGFLKLIASHEKFQGGSLEVPTPLPNQYEEALMTFLKSINTYTVAGSLVYYSGTAYDGLPLSGVYHMSTQENTVVNRESYSSISPFF